MEARTVYGTVTRERSRPDGTGTPGRMSLDNGFSRDSLELGWHDNERGRSCTAPGVDRGRVWFSPALKRLVILFEDRNGRKQCEIHNGNFAAEERDLDGDGVAEKTNVHGCTLVGTGYGPVQRSDGRMQWGIRNSVPALTSLIESLAFDDDHTLDANGFAAGYNPVEITYRWAPGCEP